MDFLLAWYRHHLPYLGKRQNNAISRLLGRSKMSHIVPHTKNENATTSGSYEHVKYHKFCIIRKSQIIQILDSTKIQISQILPRTKKENVTTSALNETFRYHKFCIVRKIQISQILFRTKKENTTNSASYENQNKKILLRTKKVKYHKLCLIPELLNQGFVVALQSGLTQFMPCTKSNISKILPCTKQENITKSASYGKVKYHKFCLVPKLLNQECPHLAK